MSCFSTYPHSSGMASPDPFYLPQVDFAGLQIQEVQTAVAACLFLFSHIPSSKLGVCSKTKKATAELWLLVFISALEGTGFAGPCFAGLQIEKPR